MILLLLFLRWAHLMAHFPHRAITVGTYRGWLPISYSYLGCECGRSWVDRCTDGDARAHINHWQTLYRVRRG